MGSSTSSNVITAAQASVTLLSTLGLDGILWPQQATVEDHSCYDYIVVGAGTAGCVVTRRLAEDMGNSVLVVEVGGDPPISSMLVGLFSLLPGSPVDYNYTSTKDDYAARSQNSYTMLTTGKMLGGSASLNHFLHSRGTSIDYDYWVKATNDSSWSYENIRPYFIKSERMVVKEILNKYGKFHGTVGPMGISRDGNDDDIAKYLESFAEVGNPTVMDLNSDENVGYSHAQFSIADEKRQTPAYTYLKHIKDNTNTYFTKNTRATKVIFENNVAVAIEAVRDGKTYTFKANKEIIICAGAYNSPQLLMLSGIGPQKHLKNFNIDVVKDLPVGTDMIDQVTVSLVHKVKKHFLPIVNPKDLLFLPTKIPFPVFIGSAALNKSQPYADYHTYNMLLQHDTPFATLACKVLFAFRDEICDRWQKQLKSRDALYTFLLHVQQKSRGTVRLRSADPFDNPLITTGYFTKDEDLQDMVKFVRDFNKVGDSKYFKEIGAGLVGLDLPECADKEKGSDDFWRCYILNHAHSPFHASGTCAMGKVVDGRLKVKGIEKLRVVDASVMPMLPRAGSNGIVVMLAEKASEDIKSDNCNCS